MRDYTIVHGVLTYYQMAEFKNHSKRHWYLKRIGCDFRKPIWLLMLKGWMWKVWGI